MRVALICRTDYGGQSAKLARALRKLGVDARSFRSAPLTTDYLRFDRDISFESHDPGYCREFFATADVIHTHGQVYRPWYPVSPRVRWVIHQHGRAGSGAPGAHVWSVWKQQQESLGAVRIVSTLNLLSYVGGDADLWLPAPFFLDEMAAIRKANWRPHEGVRMTHSSTKREYKGTDELITAVGTLREEGRNVELVLIEQMAHHECLALKATGDIALDQIHLGIGNSGMEAMAFGQPVMSWGPSEVTAAYEAVVGYVPWVQTAREDLTATLRRLVDDPGLRSEIAARGRQYVEAWHDAHVVAKRLLRIYEEAGQVRRALPPRPSTAG
jgi:hypothetical protein